MAHSILIALILGVACLNPIAFGQADVPPIAPIKPTQLEKHGVVRTDDYYWLRERENPEVLKYIEAENDYVKRQLADTEALQKTLFDEIVARIPDHDVSAPVPDRGYIYYSRIDQGQQYRVYCRRKDQNGAADEVILDVNELSQGKPFCSVAALEVSSSNNILAYAVDFVGRRKYSLFFKDLATGKVSDTVIEDVTGNVQWAEDNRTLFYTRQDPETLRWHQVFRHTLGEDPQHDPLVYQENDEEFSCSVAKSRSRRFIFIASEQTLSSECRYVSATDPTAEFQIFQPREVDHEYRIDHLGSQFFVLTNWNAKNFRLMKSAENKTAKVDWTEVVPTSDAGLLDDFELFDGFLSVATRCEGLVKIDIRPWDGANKNQVAFSEPVYVAAIDATPETKTDWLRYQFASMNTPDSVREFNVKTGETRVVKQEEVLGGFHSPDYETRRFWATATDGAKIPISLVRKKTTALDGTAPCLLYGYGSYGISMDAQFQLSVLNLLNRGFVFAIAHIRGGQEMGRTWYESGKLLQKKNTFTDFINVGEFLIAEKVADPRRLYAEGGSAGGLLIGAVINMRPDLFSGVIAEVPFVDVITTMLDDTIPLTTSEYDEWGNPNDPKYFEYMLSYSPYDNVRPIAYPNLLVMTGLHDSQVQYWEPAKWVARLRQVKTNDNLLLFKTNTDAGHGGASGRFDRYHEVVLRQAFLLKLASQSRSPTTK